MQWIESKRFDLLWIIGPAFISVFFVSTLHFLGIAPTETSPLYWLIFIVFIDVSHVWSTLFRTYMNKLGKELYHKELWLVPICCYGAGVILYSQGVLIFWRCLAYLAVFHFIRQQYGIFQIYSYKEHKNKNKRFILLDKMVIYSATIIPLLIWHLGETREMNWFIKGDFIYLSLPMLIPFVGILGFIILFTYFIKEVFILKYSLLSSKTLFLLGTVLSWWVGIVWIKTDWAFTITNVFSHGIPYFALIYARNMKDKKEDLLWPKSWPIMTIFIFLFFLGYFEEALWDIFIWRDHTQIFTFFRFLPEVKGQEILALLVPLLTLPQATHYILDGYIWRLRK